MNVGYENLSAPDVATILGVSRCTVTGWCRQGYIKFINVGNGTERPRYMFDEDEVERVRKLIDKYGVKSWILHTKEPKTAVATPRATIITTTNPEEYIPDDTDEITGYVKKIRALTVQRDKLLSELDAIDESIKTMREKVINAI